MPHPARWILRNIARRPVEIHRAAGVTVVPASGSIEVGELDAQCRALIRRGALSCHPVPPPPPAAAAEAPETAPAADAAAADPTPIIEPQSTARDTDLRTGEPA